jgi:hypothetical protein
VATLFEIRTAIAETITNNIPGISVYAELPEDVVEPIIAIYPADMDYLFTYGNSSTPWEFTILVGAASAEDLIAQRALDELVDAVGDRSIIAVLLANQTLGRTDCSLKAPVRMSNYGSKIKFGSTDLFGAIIRIGVVTTHR